MEFEVQTQAGDFVEHCRTLIVDLIGLEQCRRNRSLLATLCVQLGARMLREGRPQEAAAILGPHLDWLDSLSYDSPWEIVYFKGWLQYALGEYHRCWPTLLSALEKLNCDVPTVDDVSFAPFWLQDKGPFQDTLAAIALDLAERGLIPREALLTVFESMNGREIAARLLGRDASVTLGHNEILHRHGEAARCLARMSRRFSLTVTDFGGRIMRTLENEAQRVFAAVLHGTRNGERLYCTVVGLPKIGAFKLFSDNGFRFRL